MRVLFAALARFRADQPGGFDGALTGGGADIAPAWKTVMRALHLRWRPAVVLGTTAKLAASMRAKLASVGPDGGRQPLYSAATVAFLVDVGELQADENNRTCLCWVDLDTGALTAEGAALAAGVDGDGHAIGVPARGATVRHCALRAVLVGRQKALGPAARR
jgi:hypothetical protein